MARLKEFSTPYRDGLQPHFSQYTMVTEGIGAIMARTDTCRISSGRGDSHTSAAITRLPA